MVEPAEAEVAIIGGNETILLVEDEKSIRDLGERILRNYGYTVLMADDGESALQFYCREQEHIDLVILDLIMPGMGGKRCLEELLKVNPGEKIIIVSGYSPDRDTRKAMEVGARGYIRKPYDVRKMLNIIRNVLDEK